MKREREFDIEEIEQEWTCPITSMPMKNPVILEDGHSYEQNDIKEWLKKKKMSPKTNLPLKKVSLIPNIALRNVIQKYQKEIKYNFQKLKQQKDLLYHHIDQYEQRLKESSKIQKDMQQLKIKHRKLLDGSSIAVQYEKLKKQHGLLKAEYDILRLEGNMMGDKQQEQRQNIDNFNWAAGDINMAQQQQQATIPLEYQLSIQLSAANETIKNLQYQNQQLLSALDNKQNQQSQRNLLITKKISQLQEQNKQYVKKIQGLIKEKDILKKEIRENTQLQIKYTQRCKLLYIQIDILSKQNSKLKTQLSYQKRETLTLVRNLNEYQQQQKRTKKQLQKVSTTLNKKMTKQLKKKDKIIDKLNEELKIQLLIKKYVGKKDMFKVESMRKEQQQKNKKKPVKIQQYGLSSLLREYKPQYKQTMERQQHSSLLKVKKSQHINKQKSSKLFKPRFLFDRISSPENSLQNFPSNNQSNLKQKQQKYYMKLDKKLQQQIKEINKNQQNSHPLSIIPPLQLQMNFQDNNDQQQKVQKIQNNIIEIKMIQQQQQDEFITPPMDPKKKENRKLTYYPRTPDSLPNNPQIYDQNQQQMCRQYQNYLKEKLQQCYNSTIKNVLPLQDYLMKYPILYNQKKHQLNHSGYKVNMREFLMYNWLGLKTLNFSNCQINDIAFKFFTNEAANFSDITTLILWNNPIVDLPLLCFERYKKLKTVYLSVKKGLNPGSKRYLDEYRRKNPRVTFHYETY